VIVLCYQSLFVFLEQKKKIVLCFFFCTASLNRANGMGCNLTSKVRIVFTRVLTGFLLSKRTLASLARRGFYALRGRIGHGRRVVHLTTVLQYNNTCYLTYPT
jgi:hypothetical protein